MAKSWINYELSVRIDGVTKKLNFHDQDEAERFRTRFKEAGIEVVMAIEEWTPPTT